MKQTFTLVLFCTFLLLTQHVYSQKVMLLHSFDLPNEQSGYVFAGDRLYLNQNTYFDVLNLSNRGIAQVAKPSGPELQQGSTWGALGTSVVFADNEAQNLYIANDRESVQIQFASNTQQIVTGKNSSFITYLNPAEGFKMINIDNRTHSLYKFWITNSKADLSMEYFEKEDLIFFSNRTSPTTVEVYGTDGSFESTTLLERIQVSTEERIFNTFFINNGREVYFVNFTQLQSDLTQHFSHIYKLSANSLTKVGTFKNLQPYPRQTYIKDDRLFGYNTSTQEVVVDQGEGYKNILSSAGFVTFEGEFNSNVLFTVPDPSSAIGDSLVMLYQTDGTPAGTRIISDKVDAFFTGEKAITVHQGVLYFMKRDEQYGAELYKYDGRKVAMVEDAVPGTAGLQRVQFYTNKDELYFAAQQTNSPNQLFVFQVSDNAGSILLSTYADTNGNGEKEETEPYLPNVKFALNEGGLNVYTSQTESQVSLPYGNYKLSLAGKEGWLIPSQEITFTLPEDNGKTYSFGLTPEQLNTRVNATLMSDATRCGFPTPYTLHYSNSGTTVASGTIRLVPEKKFTFDSATPAPHEVSGDTLVWQLNELEIGKKGKILLNYTMPGVEHMGDTLVSRLFTNFHTSANSTTHADTTTLQQILTCSYDPNDIQVNPPGEGEKHLTLKKKKLEYLIRFQNMGIDKAFNIVVTNELQPELDLSTFEVIGSSHDMYTVLEGNQVSFHFDNIHLPDDKTDEPGSHGYILYTITPKAGLRDSTLIQNQAFIYFDYNPAIETNIVFNTLVDRSPAKAVLAVEDELGEGWPTVFPNPAEDKLNIAWPSGGSIYTTYSLLNSQGKVVLQAQYKTGGVHQLQLANLPAGLYFLRATRQGGTLVRKVLIR